jgi:hypothetical protein
MIVVMQSTHELKAAGYAGACHRAAPCADPLGTNPRHKLRAAQALGVTDIVVSHLHDTEVPLTRRSFGLSISSNGGLSYSANHSSKSFREDAVLIKNCLVWLRASILFFLIAGGEEHHGSFASSCENYLRSFRCFDNLTTGAG